MNKKKNYFINFFKSFSIIQVLVVSLILFALVFASTGDFLGKLGLGSSKDVITRLLDGLVYVGFGGMAIIGVSAIKSKKISFIDFIRFVGFLGGVAAGLYLIVTKTGNIRAYYILGCAGLCFVEWILRGIIAHPDVKISGFKGFMSALANKWHMPALAVLGVGLGIGMIFLTKDGLNSIMKDLVNISVGIAAGIFVVDVAQTMFTECRPTLLDAIIHVVSIAFSIYVIYFFGETGNIGISIKSLGVLFAALIVGSYIRALAYPGSEGKPSKFKIDRYYKNLFKKRDAILPIVFGFGAFAAFFVPFYSATRVEGILAKLGLDLAIDQVQMIGAIVLLVVVILSVLGSIIGKIRDDQVSLSDSFVLCMTYIIICSIGLVYPFVTNDDFFNTLTASTSNIIGLVALGINAVFGLIFLIIRWKHFDDLFEYNSQQTDIAEEEEEIEEENDEYAGLTEEEIAALEAIPEAQEEVVYVDENGNILSAEEVESAQAVEAQPEEAAEEAQPEEEADDDLDALLNAIPEKEETTEETTEEVKPEELSDEDLDELLASIPEKEEATEAINEEAQPADEDLDELLAAIPEKEETEATNEKAQPADEDLDELLAAIPEKEETESTNEEAQPVSEEAQVKFAEKKSNSKARLQKLLSYFED